MYRAVRGRWDGVCEDVLAWVWLVQDTHCVRPSKSFLFRSTLTFHPENKTKRLKDVVFAPCVDVRSLKSLRTIPIPIRKPSLPCESTWSWCERWPPVRQYQRTKLTGPHIHSRSRFASSLSLIWKWVPQRTTLVNEGEQEPRTMRWDTFSESQASHADTQSVCQTNTRSLRTLEREEHGP